MYRGKVHAKQTFECLRVTAAHARDERGFIDICVEMHARTIIGPREFARRRWCDTSIRIMRARHRIPGTSMMTSATQVNKKKWRDIAQASPSNSWTNYK